MLLLRIKIVSLFLVLHNIKSAINEETGKEIINENKNKCPFSKIIEDIFKVHNKSSNKGVHLEDNERAKLFLNKIANITSKTDNLSTNKSLQEELVNNIIASINRIKNNITADKNILDTSQLSDAIIINRRNNLSSADNLTKKHLGVKEDKDSSDQRVSLNDNKETTLENTYTNYTKRNKTYVEILTIEPNNTSSNNDSPHNIIEVLKHLMPLFNSTLSKELHNITIIERNNNRNHSFSATKNISTIVVTYCDKENLTKSNNITYNNYEMETILKDPQNVTEDASEYLGVDEPTEFQGDGENNFDTDEEVNLTVNENKDIMEAAEYGMQKMHELYSIMEPKLYSMGLWLDETNPARYVAAFNAPAEDVARFTRYGYASLQAATRLKQLTGGGAGDDGLEGRTEEAQFPSASALRQSPLLEHCPLKGPPKCPPASKRYRTHDGTCNNLSRPRWGSTMTPVQRFLPPAYSDGLQAPRRAVSGGKLPSAREISSSIHEGNNVETESITHLLMQWGQFVDHDITSSSQSRGFNGSVPRCCKDGGRDFVQREFMHPECLPIAVPSSDPFYGPRGVRCLDFVRSSPAPRDDCALGWREQMNQVSAYIDASPLYGSSARQSDKLRLFRNGMLQYGRVQQRRPLLPPERRDELCRGGAVSTDCFKSGDGRVNEHPGLVAAHIVWLRQHNRMAQELAHLNPHWSDEKIYQETRKIVGAMVQHITYREFLPIVLGSEVMRLFELDLLKKGSFRNYNPKTNPSPASSFGSAAFRFGHSLVQPSMVRFDRFHRPINNNVSLHDELTNPSNIWSMGAVDRLLLGMVNQPIQKRDEFITEELTNHLFQTPQFDFGMDLAAINIQRGRDHGVAPYTSWREPCGLTLITEFEDLFRVMPSRTVRKLQALYRHVDDIDLFTGGMAERPVVGGLVGPTFACIIAQQFSNLRKGDRFWYENGGLDSSFTPAQLQQIRRITFAQVICRTLDNVDSIQPFVFLSANNDDNDRISCLNSLLNNFDLSPWTEIDNDISKAEDVSKEPKTENPQTVKPSTVKPSTTTKSNKKPQKDNSANSSKVPHKKNPVASVANNITKASNITKKQKPNSRVNKTDSFKLIHNSTIKPSLTKLDMTKPNLTVQKIDDKLDFKNKTRRYENIDRSDNDRYDYRKKPTKQNYDYEYDDDDNHSSQTVFVNNLSYKRPTSIHRPAIAVTENIDKFTYLINYVPRPTQSWRRSTRTPYTDRDIVKVTYQTYDDTYNRRPNRPYFSNRQDTDNGDQPNYRQNKPNSFTTKRLDQLISSARSNDELTTATPMIVKKTDTDKKDKISTTENYKLVTFRYVGTYKGHNFNVKDTTGAVEMTDSKAKVNEDDVNVSNDFSTFVNKRDSVKPDHDLTNTMKLSTFYIHETATKPYNNLHRPTRRNDDDDLHDLNRGTNNKYYYVRNVLHKYPDIGSAMTERPKTNPHFNNDFVKENYNNPGTPESYFEGQERASVDKLAFLEEIESGKSADPDPKKEKGKRPQDPAKTPSVAFQIIPSENSPTLWAMYEEKSDLPEGLPHRMPTVESDPHALKEIPRPMNLAAMRNRRKHNKTRFGN